VDIGITLQCQPVVIRCPPNPGNSKIVGMPFVGGLGPMDFIQEIVGEIPLDEEFQRECVDHMKTFWKTKLEDRYVALG
jgi:hypothetical protein